MNKEAFIKHIEQTYKDGVDLIKIKNHDYAGDEDPFKNFRFAEMVGVSVPRAILVRMSDKLARISNLIDKEAAVKDETVSDTLLDLINYTAILKAFLQKEKEQFPNNRE